MAAALHAFSGKNVVKRDVDVIVGASNFALLQKAALRQCFQITPDMSLMLPEFLHQAILHPAFQKQIHKSAST